MLSIGEFARYGQVSVRMLRHYDRIGLLAPAQVDPHCGYRHYEPAQLPRLNRLLALKDLGFTLEQIGGVLDADPSPVELRAMLTMRRAQLEQQMTADRQRMLDIERRLRMIEEETLMPELQFTITSLPEVTLAQLSTTVQDTSEVGLVIGPMFDRLMAAAAQAGADLSGPTMAWYAGTEADGLQVAAGLPVGADGPAVAGAQRHTLPDVERAVTTTHHGDMTAIADSWRQLMQYCAAAGLNPVGPCREVYHATPMDRPDAWVTELQQPVT